MLRLKIREVAENQGLNKSQLQLKSGVTMPTIRRYWYNTRGGNVEGEPLVELDLVVLDMLAKTLGVSDMDLIEVT